MKVRVLLAGVAARAVMPVAGAANAAEPTPAPTTESFGGWTLRSGVVASTGRSPRVLPPVNIDGCSVWPVKRGVLPVQFKVSEWQGAFL
jgi:hypothetical protein